MRYSKKGLEKRKADREGYKEFFEKCVTKIKEEKLCCAECGTKLRGHVSEVAHVIGKSYYKSIAINDLNWIPLCGMYSDKQCHSIFDDSKKEVFKNMKVYNKVKDIFEELEPYIKEKILYKTYDKYTDN